MPGYCPKKAVKKILIAGTAILAVVGVLAFFFFKTGDPGPIVEGVPDETIKSPEPLERLYGKMVHEASGKINGLHGKTIEQVTTELGNPNRRMLWTIGQCCDEFRCELLNVYPPDFPGNSSVPIKELWWKYPDYTLVVWFHRKNEDWIALDTCRWKKGVAF